MWLGTQYGNRVALDVVPVDVEDPEGRYEVAWDSAPPQAASYARYAARSSRPDRLYRAHFVACTKSKPASAAAYAHRATAPLPKPEPADPPDPGQPSLFGDAP